MVVPLAVSVPSVPMVATVVAVLLHTPPPVASVSNVVEPSHKEKVPSIAVGCVFTVTTAVDVHVPNVYVMVAVPTPAPVTMPVLPTTVATVVLPLVQVPPALESLRADVAP